MSADESKNSLAMEPAKSEVPVLKSSSVVETECLMKEELQELEKWKNSATSEVSQERKVAFVTFFTRMLNATFQQYVTHKDKAWSLKKNIPYIVGTAILPVIGAFAGSFLSEGSAVASGITIGLIGSGWVAIKVYTDWRQNKNVKETWVRHSACFHRLHLELTRFLLSEKTDEDFECFSKRTFQILDQNLDQFVMNLSPQGLAEKSNEE